MLVTEFMAGGSVMEFDRIENRYIFSSTAAAIMNGVGYTHISKELKKEIKEDKNSRRAMTEEEVVSLSLDLLRGLHYLHSKGICHR
jgi:serine/threonine protein kinase